MVHGAVPQDRYLMISRSNYYDIAKLLLLLLKLTIYGASGLDQTTELIVKWSTNASKNKPNTLCIHVWVINSLTVDTPSLFHSRL